MPSERSLAIGLGIAQGFEKAVTNFHNIRQARTQEEDRQRKSDVDFKIKKLQLEQLEDPEIQAAKQEELKLGIQAQKTANKMNMLKINESEKKAKNDMKDRYKEGLIYQKTVKPLLQRIEQGEAIELPTGSEISHKVGDTTLKFSGGTEKSAFGGTVSDKERAGAVRELLQGYSKSNLDTLAEQEGILDKLPLGTSSKFAYAKEIAGGKIKGKLKDNLKNLGVTKDELFDWAMQQNPELARVAFPATYEMRRGSAK